MADEAKSAAPKKIVPTWGYRKGKEGVESKLFDVEEGGALPKGWLDTPAGLDQPEKKVEDSKT